MSTLQMSEVKKPELVAYLNRYFPEQRITQSTKLWVEITGEIVAVSWPRGNSGGQLIGMFGQQAYRNFLADRIAVRN